MQLSEPLEGTLALQCSVPEVATRRNFHEKQNIDLNHPSRTIQKPMISISIGEDQVTRRVTLLRIVLRNNLLCKLGFINPTVDNYHIILIKHTNFI